MTHEDERNYKAADEKNKRTEDAIKQADEIAEQAGQVYDEPTDEYGQALHVGDTVRVANHLNNDPYGRKGQTGTIIKDIAANANGTVVCVRFLHDENNRTTGYYQPDTLEKINNTAAPQNRRKAEREKKMGTELKGERVTRWTHEIYSDIITREKAERLVKEGKATIMTENSIKQEVDAYEPKETPSEPEQKDRETAEKIRTMMLAEQRAKEKAERDAREGKSGAQPERIGYDQIQHTHKVGDLTATYAELVDALGEPDTSESKGFREIDKYKSDAEWRMRILDTVVTVYNYKNGRNYAKQAGKDTEDITEWSIGGRTEKSATVLRHYLQNVKEDAHRLNRDKVAVDEIAAQAGVIDDEPEKIELGDRVTVSPELTTDPHQRQGESGTVTNIQRNRASIEVTFEELNDGDRIGYYDEDALEKTEQNEPEPTPNDYHQTGWEEGYAAGIKQGQRDTKGASDIAYDKGYDDGFEDHANHGEDKPSRTNEIKTGLEKKNAPEPGTQEAEDHMNKAVLAAAETASYIKGYDTGRRELAEAKNNAYKDGYDRGNDDGFRAGELHGEALSNKPSRSDEIKTGLAAAKDALAEYASKSVIPPRPYDIAKEIDDIEQAINTIRAAVKFRMLK